MKVIRSHQNRQPHPFPTFFASALALTILLSPQLGRAARGGSSDLPEEFDPEKLGGAMRAHAAGIDKPIFLPLRKTDVEIDMTGGIVQVEVTQEFRNETRSALEAIYLFPLPSRATITGMELRVGDRVISSTVKERWAAQKTYETAKAAGQKAALLEQERPNLFTTSVANFLPSETVRVRFSFMYAADFSEGKYALRFPMVVGPRFVPADGGVTDPHRIAAPLLHPTVDPGHRVVLELMVKGIPVKQIVSNTHPIDVKEIAGEAPGQRVTLRKRTAFPDRDFNIEIELADKGAPELTFIQSKAVGGAGKAHGLLSVYPTLGEREDAGGELPKRDVLFLIDTSGSMGGVSIGQAKRGLEKCLEMLTENDQFSIVRFSSGFSSFAPGLVAADPDNLAKAREYVAGLGASGGTQMQPALRHVLAIPGREDAMRLVVFLTDGAVGNEAELIRLLDSDLGKARLFTFGIGTAPNEFLMRKMGEAGRGQARFIGTEEDIGTAMADFFRTLESPVLTDVSLTWKDAAGEELEGVVCFPNPCPDVFRGRPLQVVAQLPAGFAGGSVEVAGSVAGEPAKFLYPIRPAGEAQAHPAIPKMFGRALVDHLMQKIYVAAGEAEVEALQHAVVQVALLHQLVTQFTSRVAVEQKVSRRAGKPLLSKKVPVPRPRGSTFAATSSDDARWLLTGIAAIVAAIGAGYFRRRLV